MKKEFEAIYIICMYIYSRNYVEDEIEEFYERRCINMRKWILMKRNVNDGRDRDNEQLY